MLKAYELCVSMKDKWEQAQLMHWRSEANDVTYFFSDFGIDFKSVHEQLFDLHYDDIQPVMYLFGKIQKAIGICTYLDGQAQKNNEDVDKIKLFQLTSHAEIAMKVLNEADTTNQKRIEGFFEPIVSKLQYRLRLSIDDVSTLSKLNEDISASSILYKLRCEYVHQGDYLGNVFRIPSSDKRVYISSSFKWDLKKSKTKKPLQVFMETNLAYNEFMQLYLEALKEHISKYISARKGNNIKQ